MVNIDLSTITVATAVIVGLVNGIQLATDKLKGFYSFLIAVAFGLMFGFLHWFGLGSPEIGIVAGLASSGLYKLTQNLGGK